MSKHHFLALVLVILLVSLSTPTHAAPPNLSADVDYIARRLSHPVDDDLGNHNTRVFTDGDLHMTIQRTNGINGFHTHIDVYWRGELVATKDNADPLVILKHGAWQHRVHQIVLDNPPK